MPGALPAPRSRRRAAPPGVIGFHRDRAGRAFGGEPGVELAGRSGFGDTAVRRQPAERRVGVGVELGTADVVVEVGAVLTSIPPVYPCPRRPRHRTATMSGCPYSLAEPVPQAVWEAEHPAGGQGRRAARPAAGRASKPFVTAFATPGHERTVSSALAGAITASGSRLPRMSVIAVSIPQIGRYSRELRERGGGGRRCGGRGRKCSATWRSVRGPGERDVGVARSSRSHLPARLDGADAGDGALTT